LNLLALHEDLDHEPRQEKGPPKKYMLVQPKDAWVWTGMCRL